MPYKLAMHNWMRTEPLDSTLKRLARYGYDGLEISGSPSEYDAASVRSALAQHRITCWGAVCLSGKSRDLIHADKYIRIGTVQYIKDCLSLVHDLGGQILTVIPSRVGKLEPMNSPEKEWAWAVEGLKECQEHAEAEGVRIGIEPLNRFETYFVNRADQALELAHQVGGTIGVCLDFFHMNMEEVDWESALRSCHGKLVDVHIADNNRMPPGQGAIDWKAALKVLTDIAYDGYLTCEFLPPMNRIPRSHRKGDMIASESSVKYPLDNGTGLISESLWDEYVRSSSDFLSANMV